MDRTFIIVKPDGMQRGLASTILGRFEARGLKIVGLKLIHIDEDLAKRHYAVHTGKPFFDGLVKYISSSPVLVAVLEGRSAVEVARNTMGTTNPVGAAPGTIRGDLALEIGRNLVHGSDSPENAAKEISLFFRPEELFAYERSTDKWVHE